MSDLIKGNKLLKKYNEIWDKFRKVIRKRFDSKPIYIKKNFKNKIKIESNSYNVKCQKRFLLYLYICGADCLCF